MGRLEEKLILIREILDNFNARKENDPAGLEIDDYVYFVEDIETAMADVLVLSFDMEN